VATQVLHVEDFEAASFHAFDRAREARDPAAGEDVLANPVLGLELADVTDEMNYAQASRLQGFGVARTTASRWSRPACSRVPIERSLSYWPGISRKSHSMSLIFSCRLRRSSLRPQLRDLLRRRIDAGTRSTVVFIGMEQQSTEAATDVDKDSPA